MTTSQIPTEIFSKQLNSCVKPSRAAKALEPSWRDDGTSLCWDAGFVLPNKWRQGKSPFQFQTTEKKYRALTHVRRSMRNL